jgi:hypothetical protein
MTDHAQSNAEFALRKAMMRHGRMVNGSHVWISEHDRWLELVFAIFASTSKSPEEQLRLLIRDLDALGLLSIDDEININNSQWITRCLEIATDCGVEELASRRAVEAVSEVAAALRSGYGGKLQKLLRQQGEHIREEIQSILAVKSLEKSEFQYALTYWLQNVLALPVSLLDNSVMEFLKQHALTMEEVVEAADSLNINLAVVDDLIHMEQTPRDGQNPSLPDSEE